MFMDRVPWICPRALREAFQLRERFHPLILVALIVPVCALLIPISISVIGLFASSDPTVGITATAEMKSPDGDSMGVIKLTQMEDGVLVAAYIQGLPEGGHALNVYETGACAPDFSAAGDHFDPANAKRGFINISGFINPSWGRESSIGPHGGDLPNLYAFSDGSARADFFTDGIALDADVRGSVFDDDGSAIIISEKPAQYGDEEVDTGARLACGVIERD